MGFLKRIVDTVFIDKAKQPHFDPVSPPPGQEQHVTEQGTPHEIPPAPVPKPHTFPSPKSPLMPIPRSTPHTETQTEPSVPTTEPPVLKVKHKIPSQPHVEPKEIPPLKRKTRPKPDYADPHVRAEIIKRMLDVAPREDAPPMQDPKPMQETDIRTIHVEDAFYLSDGRILHSLQELADAAEFMDESVFAHHTEDGRNDFASWTEHVFGAADLANKMRRATTPHELRESILHTQEDTSNEEEIRQKHAIHSEESHVDVEAYQGEIAALRQEVQRLQKALGREIVSGAQALAEQQESFRRHLEEKQVDMTQQKVHAAKQVLAMHEEQISQKQEELDTLDTMVAKHAPSDSSTPQAPTVQMITIGVKGARQALKEGRIQSAKDGYNNVRDAFMQLELPENERRELYNLIRELYTDIELAKLH